MTCSMILQQLGNVHENLFGVDILVNECYMTNKNYNPLNCCLHFTSQIFHPMISWCLWLINVMQSINFCDTEIMAIPKNMSNCQSHQSLSLIILIDQSHFINPLGTGNYKFYQSQGLSTFWGFLIFLIKPVFYLSW